MTYPTVGVVGAGQLARMMAAPAIALGVRLRVLARDPTDSAAQVIPDTVIGKHTDLDTLRAFADGCDVLTSDHEHVPTEHLRTLLAEGVTLHPGPAALEHAQDKLLMRARLTQAGIPVPRWRAVADAAELAAFGAQVGWPVVLKTPRGGYDGKGVLVVHSLDDARDWLSHHETLLAEERVDFHRELAALVARSPHGQAVAYPVVQTVQVDGVCNEVIAPAQMSDAHAVSAAEVALAIAAELGVVGVLAVEMFDTADGVLVNELAMRPHNCGHWSIEAAITSQFENHLRAVLNLPLGDPRMLAPHAVMANVFGGDHPDMYRAYLHLMARDPGLHVHMYGKTVRPGRKLGHVTVLGADVDALRERAGHAAGYLRGTIGE